MKRLSLLLAFVTAVLLSVPARADITLPGLFDDRSYSFGETFASGLSGATFSNTIDFTLGADNVVGWLFSTQVLGTHDLTLQTVTLDGNPFATSETFSIGSGAHSLTIAGLINGTGESSYVGLLQTAAIPEPGTVALLLAGLGAMSFVARRRRQV